MDTQTRKWVAAGLLVSAGGITLLVAARRVMPKMMGKMMRGMMQSMMKQMADGEGKFDPQEM